VLQKEQVRPKKSVFVLQMQIGDHTPVAIGLFSHDHFDGFQLRRTTGLKVRGVVVVVRPGDSKHNLVFPTDCETGKNIGALVSIVCKTHEAHVAKSASGLRRARKNSNNEQRDDHKEASQGGPLVRRDVFGREELNLGRLAASGEDRSS